MIQLGVTRLKKTGFVYLLVVVWRKGGEGVCDLVMIELMVVLLTHFSRMVWF